MDSVTQIVLGAAVGEAALGRKVGNKAMLWGAIAGTIPDLDVIGRYFLDDITALEWHRGFSHSLVFSLLAAPIFGFLIYRFSKSKEASFKDWTRLMFLGFVTHPLLDCHTTWGTQFFWPLDLRIAYQNIFVVDPLYTIPFIVFLILAMRLHRADPRRRKLNRYGLIVSSAYMVITIILKFITLPVFTSNLDLQGREYKRISTRPTPFNSILWTANVETQDSFLIGYYSLLDEDRKVHFKGYPKNHHMIDSIKNEDQIKRLIHVSKRWYVIQERDSTLVFCDLRFGEQGFNTPDNRFVFTNHIIKENDQWVIKQIEPSMEDAGPMMKVLFDRVLGKEKPDPKQ